jgi:hypothetical protein
MIYAYLESKLFYTPRDLHPEMSPAAAIRGSEK